MMIVFVVEYEQSNVCKLVFFVGRATAEIYTVIIVGGVRCV